MIARYSTPEMSDLWSDASRLRLLLLVELEFLKVLAGPKKIPAAELRLFEARIAQVRPAAVAKLEEKTRHDVVALLEASIAPISGRAKTLSRYLHYGLTSSDLLDTALALQARSAAGLLILEWGRWAEALAALAQRHRGLLIMGRTHGIHAEPESFAAKLAGFHAEALRNRDRLKAAREAVSYGKLSGAVGNFAHLNPAWEAAALRKLGLKPEPVSTQVVPRDRHAEYLGALALSAAAVERFAVELRHLSRTELGEAAEPFGKAQKGSSAMPHKKNPVLSENLCGLARLVRAYAGAALEDVALWHERDISHSSVERVVFPDAANALHFMLRRGAGLIESLEVHRGRIRENLDKSRGMVFSQSVLLALADKGLGRLEAYRLVQGAALRAAEEGKHLGEALRRDPEVLRHLSAAELERCFSYDRFLKWEGELLKRGGLA